MWAEDSKPRFIVRYFWQNENPRASRLCVSRSIYYESIGQRKLINLSMSYGLIQGAIINCDLTTVTVKEHDQNAEFIQITKYGLRR